MKSELGTENPPEPPFGKGGLGGFRQVVTCVGVLGTFGLEPLIAHAVAWANGKVHVRLNRYPITRLPITYLRKLPL